MKYVICSVRDRAANCFGTPFFTNAVGAAIRNFHDAINNTEGGNVMSTHPEDFDLFHLGVFDDAHARFELLEAPVQIAIGKDVVLKPLSLASVGRAVSS